MPDRPKPPPQEEFTEVFLKGSGPGGQKIVCPPSLVLLRMHLLTSQNKTSSAVQLKHLPTGIVLKVQETRSREQNRKIAREKLAEQLEVLEKGDKSRKSVVGSTKAKRKASGVKKSKRKYRLLEEEKLKKAAGVEGEETP